MLGDFEPARKALKRFDPGLEIWWSPWREPGTDTPGRWRIMQWGERAQNWIHILYWKYDDGSYRPLYPIGALIAKLESMRVPLKLASEDVDEQNEKVTKARRTVTREMIRDHYMGTRKRGQRFQRVFGQGVIRPRRDINMPTFDPEYIKEMQRLGSRRYG